MPIRFKLRAYALTFVAAGLATALPGCPPPPRESTGFSGVWANSGEDKVTRRERRASNDPSAVLNPVWDGATISLSAARNEIVAFALILEAADADVAGVSVAFDQLSGPGGYEIRTQPGATGADLFDSTQRPIELFYVRYLQIRGLSLVSYDTYDERHIPNRLRRPFEGEGEGRGRWEDRPDHDAWYPDIAVPIEVAAAFDVAAGSNQAIWCDIYVPKSAPAGEYAGSIELRTASGEQTIPVSLEVFGFALADEPSAPTMAYLGYEDIVSRYVGENADAGSAARVREIRDRHFQMAHRHRVSLMDGNEGLTDWDQDAPRPEWRARLDGSLFTADRGYDGPGVGIGNSVFAIGAYGTWGWMEDGEAAMREHTDAWESWFEQNAPQTERFLYLTDEPDPNDFPQVEQWAAWVRDNPGPGGALRTFVTGEAPVIAAEMPSVDVAASWTPRGLPADWIAAHQRFESDMRRRFYFYNAFRPYSGTFATEDDGVALRHLAWTQFKLGIDRWFYWETTYYNNFLSGAGQVNVFREAQTFGEFDRTDRSLGRTGYQYANGDGLLFYPGTDRIFPAESYDLPGPIASLRLKHWRRGLQDVEYLALAEQVDADQTRRIIERMAPTALWEVGITDPNDPTYVLAAPDWSTEPADWDAARRELAQLILRGR